MKNILYKLISMIIVTCMIGATCVSAFAAESTKIKNSDTEVVSPTFLTLTLNQVNGVATETGGARQYTSTTTANCTVIKVKGTCDSVSPKTAAITVYFGSSSVPMAEGTVQLDGLFHTLTMSGSNLYGYYPAGLYTVVVTPTFSGGYDASTYFYY